MWIDVRAESREMVDALTQRVLFGVEHAQGMLAWWREIRAVHDFVARRATGETDLLDFGVSAGRSIGIEGNSG